ncbi:6-phosphogluconolactonase [Candidatus Liberibacter asiaticus]|uniref:6-phosphogluconolactonase n=2 Tax=Liberibacter asiaticus TaxID=34021 RepID=C6XF26_LIBAP|nr:6-phosphogluconolactonase [Candidatus Liberibacter asiaticus]ACT56978.1 6-phosphogluconolactonase [Candidatus Liberibacter asiaticus str. psy62]AGH17056.1 6-phosphogluconolactonase [Candidatus Liberibacter asiaticus str. gxpsy]ALK07381.1 6-phosphogluconolactonase [Candidatus Liberibacter asiaticus]ASK52872.1 6-phosphogluconolactonase [Candidatus Liberibacter asiaticus]AWL14190.1 6-phosphogluconolactonase [Candidatus Liberibacter asiaticus]
MLQYKLYVAENKKRLAQKLAKKVAEQLSIGITNKGTASIALSGGLTPRFFLEELSIINVDWHKVVVTLVDERFVPLENLRSNQSFISKFFLQNKAQKASFIPLYYPQKTIEEAIRIANEKICQLIHFPFDVVVLGMGIDGHTASFFPKGDTLSIALDTHTPRSVIAIKDYTSNEQRMTMTFSALHDAQFLALHIEGTQKKHVLEKAISGDDALEMPIRAILWNAQSPLEVHWTS